jgi:hypothetical protein
MKSSTGILLFILFFSILSCQKVQDNTIGKKIVLDEEVLECYNPSNSMEYFGINARNVFKEVTAMQIDNGTELPTIQDYWDCYLLSMQTFPVDNSLDTIYISDAERSKIDLFFDLTSIESFSVYCDSLKEIEDFIIASDSFTTHQQARLLAMSSLIKYTYYSVLHGDPTVGIGIGSVPDLGVWETYLRHCIQDKMNSMNNWAMAAFIIGLPQSYLWLIAECGHYATVESRKSTQ